MDWIYGYIKNIVIFMLMTTMILNLYPREEFEKYIRLFAGLLLLLLMLHPVLQWKEKSFSPEAYLETMVPERDIDFEKRQKELEQNLYERMDGKTEKNRIDFFDEK
ncbi:MAG: stage III sporulation protein AF [Eubacterium sp.]|nr:stage III sporulation protein AF [Eubacterium sp.]